jgi:hypothetical protein
MSRVLKARSSFWRRPGIWLGFLSYSLIQRLFGSERLQTLNTSPALPRKVVADIMTRVPKRNCREV